MQLVFPPGDTFDPDSISWVMDDQGLDLFCELARGALVNIMDLETTGLDEHERIRTIVKIRGRGKARGPVESQEGCDARVALASITMPHPDDPDPTKPLTWVIPLSHPEGPFHDRWVEVFSRICLAIWKSTGPLENQNVKFDCRWVHAHTGVDLSHRIAWDPMIGAHLLDENNSTKLKEWVPRHIPGVERWDDFDLSEPGAAERVPLEQLGVYAARDTYWTWRAGILQRQLLYINTSEEEAPYFREEIVNARLGNLATWCAMPQTATLTAMEQRGVGFDREKAQETLEEYAATTSELKESLVGRYPQLDPKGASFAPTSSWFRLWADAAVEAGDLHIAALTKTGRPKWAKGVLVRQAREGREVAEDLLDYRRLTKRMEFINSWMGYCQPDGRIYAKYNQGSVVTGRLSSSGPNMQQVTAALRPLFIPSPGHLIIDLDYSQIELRIAAFISQCLPMIEAYREGKDLHRIMAAQIVNHQRIHDWEAMWGNVPGATLVAPEDVSDVERQAGKAANFGLLYGMQALGFMEYAEEVYGVSFTPQEAALVHQAFFDLWEGLREWHARMGALAQRYGEVTSPIGRVRRIPNIDSGDQREQNAAIRVAINSPVQGFASDMMQIAAACIEGNIPRVPKIKGARILGTVHDSIFMEVPEDRWEVVGRRAQAYMTEIVPRVLKKMDCTFDIPLQADAKVGTRWGLKDVATF